MKFIQGVNKDQIYLFPVSLEESIGLENAVRAVVVFVENLPFKEIGLKVDFVENGRPAYHPKWFQDFFCYQHKEENQALQGV